MEIEELRELTTQLIESEEQLRQSEANLTTFFNSITELAIVFDLKLNIIAFNDAVSTTLGYTHDEFGRLTLYDLVSEQDTFDISSRIDNVVNNNETIICELHIHRKDTTSFVVEAKTSLSTWNDKPSIICIARDITERLEFEKKITLQSIELGVYNEELRAIEEELTTRNNFLESMVSALPVPIFYKDMDGKFRDCNIAFVEFYGAPKHYILGKTTRELFPEYADDLEAQDKELLRTKSTVYFNHIIHDRDMLPSEYVIIKTIHYDFNHNPIGIIGTAVCIHHPLLHDVATAEVSRE